MGEKILVKTEEEEEAFNQLVMYYRGRNVSVHKDNEHQWEINKWENKHKNHKTYRRKAKEFEKKEYRQERRQDIQFQKDLREFEKYYLSKTAEPFMYCSQTVN